MNKKTIGIIVAIVVICGGAFGGWMYHSAQIDKMRSAGVKELNGIAVLDDYREAQQGEISQILEDSESKIEASKDQKAVDAVVDEAKASIGGIKTSAQLDIEEGIAALDKSVSLDAYRKKQQKKVTKIMDAAKASIAEAGSPEAIQDVIKDAQAQIAKIKTDKQLTAEEKAAAEKAAAEKKAREEAEARAAAEAAAAAARQKQQQAYKAYSSKKSSSKKSSSKKSKSKNSDGCVGNDAANYY